jgi:hypothetical protein
MEVNKQTKLTREKGWTAGVSMDAEEAHALKIWLLSHICRLGIDADFIIKQSSSSGIGTNTVIRCSCGEGKDVTNYGSW